jgi:phage terminase large subunit-like protein
MADNVVVKSDEAGNIKPDKARSTEKIDGIVALIMGLDRAIRHGGEAESYSFEVL